MSNDFGAYLDNAADGHCIYVLGAQGEVLTDMTPAELRDFIATREHNNQQRINEDMCGFNLRKAQGFEMIQAYDCSGLIVHFVEDMHHEIGYDTTAQGLYYLCSYHPTRNELQKYDLVFIGSNKKAITHVGVYMGDGLVIESRRFGYGVQYSNFDDRPWTFFGHLSQLDDYLNTIVHPRLEITSPMQKGEHIKLLQRLLNEYGFECGKVDGKYGKKTNTALQDFIDYYQR